MIPVTLALSVNPQSTNKTEDPFVRPRKRGPANKKATLVDVAERANVSAITVSRVINQPDRKSTRLNSSHVAISYAVFCLKKKKKKHKRKKARQKQRDDTEQA